MAKLNDISNWLNSYLKNDEIQDNCWNGLQIEGAPNVKKIALAVDAGLDIFKKTTQSKANLLIVHHGHFWKEVDPTLTSWRKERLQILLDNNISLYASHLPLDRHSEVGHNAQIIQKLGAFIQEDFYLVNGANVGYIGAFKEERLRENVIEQLNTILNTTATVLPFGTKHIKTVAVCSGHGGYGAFYEALRKKVDLYITGDAVEIYQTAKDAAMNVVFAGHHATETLGLKALADVISKKYEVETLYIDEPTGL